MQSIAQATVKNFNEVEIEKTILICGIIWSIWYNLSTTNKFGEYKGQITATLGTIIWGIQGWLPKYAVEKTIFYRTVSAPKRTSIHRHPNKQKCT